MFMSGGFKLYVYYKVDSNLNIPNQKHNLSLYMHQTSHQHCDSLNVSSCLNEAKKTDT